MQRFILSSSDYHVGKDWLADVGIGTMHRVSESFDRGRSGAGSYVDEGEDGLFNLITIHVDYCSNHAADCICISQTCDNLQCASPGCVGVLYPVPTR